jgi:hypothetical protein
MEVRLDDAVNDEFIVPHSTKMVAWHARNSVQIVFINCIRQT